MSHPSTQATPTAALSALTPRVVLSFVGTLVIAFMAANLVPVLIAGMVTHLDIDISIAGLLATCMSLASVFAMLITNGFVARGNRAAISRVGLVLLAGGYFLAAALMNLAGVATGLIIGGVGIGIVLACGTAAQSSTVNPDRTVTTVMVINRIGATSLLAIAPLFQGDLRAVLITIGCLGVLGLVVAGSLPSLRTNDVDSTATPTQLQTITALGIVLAVATGLWSVTEDMVYSMTSVLADRAGIAPNIAGWLLSGKVFGGLIGALLAPVALKRLGRSTSLLIIVVVSTAAKFAMITATDPLVYGLAISIWGVMYGAVLVLLLGLAAIMDITGRTAVVVMSVYLTGIALGPMLGGQLIGAVTPLVYAIIVTVPSIAFGLVLFKIARVSRKFEDGNTTAIPVTTGTGTGAEPARR